MLPQLSQLFHQHKKAFVSLSHFFFNFFYYKQYQQHFIVCNVATSLLPFKIPAALWKKNKKKKSLHMQLLFRTTSKTCCHLFVLKSGLYNVLWYISLDIGIFNEGNHALKVQCDQLTNACDDQDHQDSKPKIYTSHTIAILTVTL